MDAAFTSSLPKCFRLSGIKRQPSRELLGQGAYGVVEEYTYRELRCAGKRLIPVLTQGISKEQGQALLKNSIKECQTLSTLKHPNIVQFLGIHFEEGDPNPILIMEYVPYTLSSFLEQHKDEVIPPEITYGILVDVAQALCYLHGGDPIIIHRDLSANNVLLTTDLRAKVSDLGTARILNVSVHDKIKQYKKMSKMPGTPVYMPPEARLEEASYNENIDCYSYGVLMLHILNRDWPILSDSIRNEEHQVVVLTDTDRRQKHIDKIDADHPLKGLILRCLDHKNRRPTAKEILKKVQSVQKQYCKVEPDRLALLTQLRLDSENKAYLKKQVDQLSNEIKSNKLLCSVEAKRATEEIERLTHEKEMLQSVVDSQTIELKALETRVQTMEIQRDGVNSAMSEMLHKKDEQINITKEKLRTYKEQKDDEIKELLLKKQEEIDTIKKDAEEKVQAYQEQKDKEVTKVLGEREEEITTMRSDFEKMLHTYQKIKDDEVAEKKDEMDTYKAMLHKKEEIIEAAIKRDAERAQKAHEALHRSRSEQGTVLEYLRSGMQMHPLHHRARQLKWRQGPSLPMGMTAPQCVLIKSSLYVGGGQTVITEKDCRSVIFEYNTLETNGEKWNTPFSPSPTVYFGLGELNEKLVIVGGEIEAEDKQTCVTGDVFVLVEGGTSWTNDVIPALNIPRIRSCVVSYKGCIAACGGLEGTNRECSDTVEIYKSEGREWWKVTSLPVSRAALRVSVIHKTAYFLGGFHPNLASSGKPNCMSIELEDLFQDDLKSQRKWNNKFQDCPCESSTPANLCGALIAVGGLDSQGSHTKAIHAYSPAVNKWYMIDELPIKLSTATACVLTSGELVVLGGKLKGGASEKDRNKNVYIGLLE